MNCEKRCKRSALDLPNAYTDEFCYRNWRKPYATASLFKSDLSIIH